LKQYLLIILFSIFSFPYVWGEAIGTWKVYPSYSDVSDIVPTGKEVFVLASNNLYSYNVNDGSLRTYSNNDLLNGCNIQNIAWMNVAKKLIITYSDYTIDLLSLNGNVENISSLAEKQTTEDKTVNSIYVDGQYAYLATGFGIVKVNGKDATIADSYNLGCKVNYCYISGNYLYAASESKGLMKCALTANLLNKNEWTSAGDYKKQDKEKYVYDSTNKCYWATDSDSKLTKYQKSENGSFEAVSTGVIPDGPRYNEHNYILYNNGRILSVRGRYEYVSSDTNTPGFVQEYDIANNKWMCYDNSFATEKGKDCIAQTQISVDPKDRNHIMVAAKSGLYEYKDRKMVAYYDMNTDDPVLSVIQNVNYSVVTSTVYDKSGNLWVFNMGNDNILCLTPSGEWKSFQQSGLTTNGDCRIKKAFFDSRGLLWYANDNWKKSMFGFYDIKTNQMRQITSFINQRGTRMLEAKNLFTVAEDKEHNIWVGSEVGAFYITPDDVTEMCGSTDMNNISIKQAEVKRNDGTNFIDYLLSNVFICDIKVDNANRKWFATTNGVYLISSDNQTELAHFTMNNSPLPNNEVKSIAIDENSGMVYFATLNGLCSYQSDVTKSYGNLTDDNVYAYPNPVTPDFTGDITITGLTVGAQVKILTTSGQLVNEGTCTGGSYLWNGCDRNGKKVASGVYMVNVATSDGENGIVTKISIVR
jgi:hypothetical protein